MSNISVEHGGHELEIERITRCRRRARVAFFRKWRYRNCTAISGFILRHDTSIFDLKRHRRACNSTSKSVAGDIFSHGHCVKLHRRHIVDRSNTTSVGSGDVFREDGILCGNNTNACVNTASSSALFARAVTSEGCVFMKRRPSSNSDDRAVGIQRHRRNGNRSRTSRCGFIRRQNKDCTAVDCFILRQNGALRDFQVGRTFRYRRDVIYANDSKCATTSTANSRAYRIIASTSNVPGKYRGLGNSLTR